MRKHWFGLMVLAAVALVAMVGPALAQDGKKLRVVIIDGQNNHNWRATTPWMKKVLEESGRFSVAVSSHLKPGDQPGEEAGSIPFPPDLSQYDVVLSNYNGQNWPKEFNDK